LQKKYHSEIKLYASIAGDGFVSLRIYDLSSGFERQMDEFIHDKEQISFSFPLLISENETESDTIHRQYLLTAFDSNGGIDISSLHVNLSHPPDIVEEKMETMNNLSSHTPELPINSSLPLAYVTQERTIYEDKGFAAVKMIPALLFIVQLVFLLKLRKLKH
jgi:hypothetical protein